MANIAVFHTNALVDSDVAATNVDSASSEFYLSDDRLSFKFQTTVASTVIQIDQPSNNIRDWRHLTFVDHNLTDSTAVLKTYASAARSTPTVLFSGTVSGDPALIDSGSTQSAQYVDVDVFRTTGSDVLTIGELQLVSKFDSPQRPAVGIQTQYIPRRTFVDLPNGERQSIKHAGVTRRKSYTIAGMDFPTASGWIDIFTAGEGNSLVILQDEQTEIYPALMNQQLFVSDQSKIVSVNLQFDEVKPT